MTKVIENFIKGTEKGIREWIGDDLACVIGLVPDGIFYAKPLAEYLKGYYKNVEYAEIDTEELEQTGKEIKLEKDGKRDFELNRLQDMKVLLVDNDIVTSRTYKLTMKVMKSLEQKFHIKDVKFVVYEDRTGLADFAYQVSTKVLIRKRYFDLVKEELEKLKPIREKLLEVWKEVPQEYRGEMLAVLMNNTKEWREWERDNETSPDQIMAWLRGSLCRAAYSYPEIKVLNGLKNSSLSYLKKEV